MLAVQNCFICHSPAKSLNKCFKNVSKIKTQITAFFFMRKLLEISSATCIDLLTIKGNPSCWFVCCSKCFALIRKAEDVFNQLLKIESEWRTLKNNLESTLVNSHTRKKTDTKSDIFEHTIREEICKRLLKNDTQSAQTQNADLIPGEKNESDFEDIKIEMKEENLEHENELENSSFQIDEDDGSETSYNSFRTNYLKSGDRISSPLAAMKKIDVFNQSSLYKTRSGRAIKKPKYVPSDENSCDYFPNEQTPGIDLHSKKHRDSDRELNSDDPAKIKIDVSNFDSKLLPVLNTKQKSADKFTGYNKNTELFECNLCSKKYTLKRCLSRHRKKVHFPDDPVKKPPPDYKFQVEIDKSLPLNGDTTTILKCRSCTNIFETAYKQYEHENYIHGMNNRFVCILCDNFYTTERGVMMHFLQVHAEKSKAEDRKLDKGLMCSECGKTFLCNSQLKTHVETVHKSIRNFVCETCSQTFTRLRYMKFHQMREHNAVFDDVYDVTKLQCKQCGKVMSEPATLRAHIRSVHEKKFRFHCHICNVGRISQSAMNRHVRMAHKTQTSDNPQQCSICHQMCVDKVRLSIHMRSHRQEAPYKCKKCNKAFFHLASLQKHEQIHDGTTYNCEICHKKFQTKQSISLHRRAVHKIRKRIDETKPKKMIEKDVS